MDAKITQLLDKVSASLDLDIRTAAAQNPDDSGDVSPIAPSGIPYSHSQDPALIDPRIKLLSYSSLLTLHACPKKFQLQRLRAAGNSIKDLAQEITFSFGHVVGDVVQAALDREVSPNSLLLSILLRWDQSVFDTDPKKKKSIWDCVHAVQSFRGMMDAGFLEGWELLQFNGAPAKELSYSIELDHGFMLRGFVDAVMIHPATGEVRVIEIKTDGSNTINPAKYKNSSQGAGFYLSRYLLL
jgi:hypothetical protein